MNDENGSKLSFLPKSCRKEGCIMFANQLASMEKFTRKDYYDAYREKHGEKTQDALDYALRREVAAGNIVHVGRNQYAYAKEKRLYTYEYSDAAGQVAVEIQKEYPQVDFRIFELIQLNAFVNHLYAHNTIFVSVENDAIDFVFDSLRDKYPGRIMLKPKVDEYFRYLVDDQIVVLRLPSESPKGIDAPWKSRLEKILVDIMVDKLLTQIVSESEYDAIFLQAFERYLVDTSAMLRYANRKGAGIKFRERIEEYTDIAIGE